MQPAVFSRKTAVFKTSLSLRSFKNCSFCCSFKTSRKEPGFEILQFAARFALYLQGKIYSLQIKSAVCRNLQSRGRRCSLAVAPRHCCCNCYNCRHTQAPKPSILTLQTPRAKYTRISSNSDDSAPKPFRARGVLQIVAKSWKYIQPHLHAKHG